MTLKPTANLQLNMYVDANFVGMWHKEFSETWLRMGTTLHIATILSIGPANYKPKYPYALLR